MSSVRIRLGDWPQLGPAALAVRETVFVIEQGVPRELERDNEDPHCVHAVAFVDERAVGTGRLTPDGHIGRMAVLAGYRGRGVGSHLLTALLECARERGDTEIVLNAQLHAIPFYRRHGFVALGPEFQDAGIIHRRMQFQPDGPNPHGA